MARVTKIVGKQAIGALFGDSNSDMVVSELSGLNFIFVKLVLE